MEAARARAASGMGMVVRGSVGSVRGLALLVDDLAAGVGSLVRVLTREGVKRGEVVAFEGRQAVVLLFDHSSGVRASDVVEVERARPVSGVGRGLLGRVVNGLGEAMDGKGRVRDLSPAVLYRGATNAMERGVIDEPLRTGVRAIDLMTPVGKGQRLGLFAGPGVGKSTLLADVARGSSSDVSVVALVGERGREVREFIEHTLGPEGLARSVLIVATGDESPLLRVRAALAACAVSEWFAGAGMDVMLIIDSVTRLAHAQRQIGLAAGEPPATKGFPPSVFALLPSVLERAGKMEGAGSVTAFYSVLVEGDDMTEPITDAVRGILDGHVVMSRALAQKGHFPAVNVLDSVSRLGPVVMSDGHAMARREVVGLMAAYAEAEELIRIGAYVKGSDAKVDAAIELKGEIDGLLRHGAGEEKGDGFGGALERMVGIAQRAGQMMVAKGAGGGMRVRRGGD